MQNWFVSRQFALCMFYGETESDAFRPLLCCEQTDISISKACVVAVWCRWKINPPNNAEIKTLGFLHYQQIRLAGLFRHWNRAVAVFSQFAEEIHFQYETFVLLFTFYTLQFTFYIVLSISRILWHPLRLGPQFDTLPNNIWRHTVWCRTHETFRGLPQAVPCLALMTVWYVTCRKILISLDAEGLHARGVLRGGERSEVHIKFCHKAWRKEMALNI